MKHKLIIIDGPSTVGKSSISKGVYEQLAAQDAVYWLHEECEKHPIRDGEFEAGDIHTIEGMEQNRRLMLDKWDKFRESIEESGKICVTEGCYFHAIDRYLLESVWDDKQIFDYMNEVLDIIRPLNPLVVLLYRPDLKTSFEKAFSARGDWWRDLILRKPEPYGYFETHAYTGEDSVFAGILYEQQVMMNVYKKMIASEMQHYTEDTQAGKMMIDTSGEEWESYIEMITESLGYRYQSRELTPTNPGKYCGSYQMAGGDGNWDIHYDSVKNELYSTIFWPYMPMKYKGNEDFELLSFPVRMHFEEFQGKMSFTVEGNYDWDFNEKRFVKK